MASDGATGEDREDGQETAKRKAAAAAVGDGAVSTGATPHLTSIPPNQRASDSHDYTRLAALKVLNASFEKTRGRLKKRGIGLSFAPLSAIYAALRVKGVTTTWEPGYTSQKRRQFLL